MSYFQRMIEAVADYGFGTPAFINMLPRVTYNGMALAACYEVPIPKAQQPNVDDRKISGELAGNEKEVGEMQLIADERHGKKRQRR